MDSITHVILGAACGELVLGKKMGNRAMIWGSIGGSIPDFDVIANFFLDPLHGMLFHRGPMHSLLFVLIIPFILGPLLKTLYDREWHSKRSWKIAGLAIGLFLYLVAGVLLSLIWSLLFEGFPWVIAIILVITGFVFFRKRFFQIFKQDYEIKNASTKEWILLFSLSVLIHPLLDALTTYGTVLFWPFSDVRIAISSIAIADPLYTIPFAIFVMLAAVEQRNVFRRSMYNALGIGLSSSYLLLTFINKQYIDHLFEQSLKVNHVNKLEYITVPTILNNVLWYGIAKKDSGYVYSYYSLLDKKDTFEDLQFIPGNHESLEPYRGQEPLRLLTWFSDGYYSVLPLGDNKFQYNDLRFGSKNGKMIDKEDYIFKFNLIVNHGMLEMEEHQKAPDNKREDVEYFKRRIFGKK